MCVLYIAEINIHVHLKFLAWIYAQDVFMGDDGGVVMP